MIVANFVTNRSTMSETRTYEDFYKVPLEYTTEKKKKM